MLEILTPLSKGTRVSRVIDPDNFLSVPGIWAKINSAGGLDNITTATPALGTRLVLSNSNVNVYEANDVKVGRITTLETPGFRCRVSVTGYVDSVNVAVGGSLVVSANAGDEGLLAMALVADVSAGTYEIVARVEEFDATDNILTYVTVSPVTFVVS